MPALRASDTTQAERAYQALLERLIMLTYAPGEPLHEAHLSAELGFGRTPIREALKRLEVDGFVALYPRRGTFVTHVDVTQLSALYEFRESVEPIAARLAARHHTDAHAQQLRDIRDELDQAHTLEDADLMRLDMRVHAAIYRASANQYLEESLVRANNLATRIWCVALGRIDSMHGHVDEHRHVLQAVLDRDEDQAAERILEHVRAFEAAVRAVL